MLHHMIKSSFFFVAVTVYFALKDTLATPSLEAVVIKVLPIVSLAVFVLVHSWSSGKISSFSVGIMLGLLVSGVGDCCLVYKKSLFLHALAAFSVAQIIYGITFGLRPFKPLILIICLSCGSAMYAYLYPGLEDKYVVLIGLYILLIYYMAWRALARCQFQEGKLTWGQSMCAIGSVSFLISDFVIGVDRFLYDVPHRSMVVMTTYYLAQFGITMAVTDYPGVPLAKKTE